MKMECAEALERSSLHFLPMADRARDPSEGAGYLDRALAHHLASCAECASDVAFMARLARARPDPPPDLLLAIVGRSQQTPLPTGWSSGAVAAAAVLLLSLGMGLISHHSAPPHPLGSLDALVTDMGTEVWEDDEWYVAGAPVLEALPDQMLLALLEEETW